MMKGITQYISLVLFISLMISCQKNIDIEYVPLQSKLVVNATFTPDSVFKIHVSQTGNLTDENQSVQDINFANVLLKEDDLQSDPIRMYNLGDGYYKAYDYYPQEGKTYYLEVAAAGFETVYAHNSIPDKVQIIELDTMTVQMDQGAALLFDFTLENTDDQPSNFLIYDVVNTNRTVKGNQPFSPESWIESTWLRATQLDSEHDDNREFLQSKIFEENKGSYLGALQTSFLSFENFNPEDAGNHPDHAGQPKVFLRIMSVSEELYEYSKSLEYYRLNNQVNSNQSVPLEIYSNVVGGYGVFGGYSQSLKEL